MSDDVIKTLHARMTRGTTKKFDRIHRDAQGRRVDLTGATIWYSVRPNQKVVPSIRLTSKSPAALTLGIGTIIEALQGGDDVEVALVSGVALTLVESLVTTGLSVTNRLVTVTYNATVSTTADLEALIATSTLIKVKTPSPLQSHILVLGDAMTATALEGGAPNEWRTGIVIDPDQNSFRGHFTITLVPADTNELVAMGDDDPWLHECDVQLSDGTIDPHFGTSKLAIYPETTDVPT